MKHKRRKRRRISNGQKVCLLVILALLMAVVGIKAYMAPGPLVGLLFILILVVFIGVYLSLESEEEK